MLQNNLGRQNSIFSYGNQQSIVGTLKPQRSGLGLGIGSTTFSQHFRTISIRPNLKVPQPKPASTISRSSSIRTDSDFEDDKNSPMPQT